MARQRIVPVYAVNIAADPHPNRVYLDLLNRASSISANARGSDYARITAPVPIPSQTGLYAGKFLVWTEIDMEGDWIDLSRQDKLSDEDRKSIKIPESARPNFRIFEYIFNIDKRRMFIEGRNDLDKTLSPNTVMYILNKCLSKDALGDNLPGVAVTMIPEEGVAEELLQVPHIKTIFIRVTRPNPEFASPAATRRVYAKMDAMNVHTIEQKLIRNADADTVILEGKQRTSLKFP